MSKPLIAIDATLVAGDKSGDSTYWTALIQALGQLESEFQFLLLSNDEKPKTVPLPSERFKWVRLPRRASRWFSWVSMPLFARRAGAAAFHTQYNLSPLARRGITTIHDVSFFVGPEWFQPRDRTVLQRLIPGSAKRAHKVVTVSEASKNDIVKHLQLPRERVAVTPLAGHPTIKRVDNPSSVLHRLGISQPYILSVSSRWPRKNMQLAIDAVSALPPHLPHSLVLSGKKQWGDEKETPRVISTGYLSHEDLSSVYSGAALYLCPSHYEGFGIPLVEAFTCGVPVITSAGGSLGEVAGDAAIVMEDMTPAAWTQRITETLSDSSILESLRQRGALRAQDFSWMKTAKLTLDVYREVIR